MSSSASAPPTPPDTLSGNSAPVILRLDRFEGPLDLLLSLIERRELDITAVSVAAVADQYLEHVRRLEPLPADDLAAFLVMAGKLLLIKSRALLPREPLPAEPEEEDPAEELARRLREYRAFKQAALALAEIEARGERTFPRIAPPPAPGPAPLAPITPRLLVRALERLLAGAAPVRQADEVAGVPAPQPTIPERMALIEALVAERGRFHFAEVIRAARDRREIVVGFLALLELLKAGRVQVFQAHRFGEIAIERAAPEPAPVG